MAFRKLWILNVDFYVIVILVLHNGMTVKSYGTTDSVTPEFEVANTTTTRSDPYQPLHLTQTGTSIQLCIYRRQHPESQHETTCRDRCIHKMYIDDHDACQCDTLCIAYGDCCYDYEHECLQDSSPLPDLSTPSGNIEDIEEIHGEHSTDYDSSSGLLGAGGVPPFFPPAPDRSPWELESHEYWNGVLARNVSSVTSDLSCIRPVENSNTYLLRDSCSISTPTSHLCTSISSSRSDPFSFIPVLGTDNIHYKNIYCALCNGIKDTSVSFWEFYLSNCTITAKNNNFVINETCNVGVSFGNLHTKNKPRVCSSKMSVKCPDEILQLACNSYSAPITINGTLFKNPHCMQCQGENPSAYSYCPYNKFPLFSADNNGTIDEVPDKGTLGPSFSIFFDFGSGSAKLQKQGIDIAAINFKKCKAGTTFDPFTNVCRQLFCPENFIFSNGTCVRPVHNSSEGIQPGVFYITMGFSLHNIVREDDWFIRGILENLRDNLIFNEDNIIFHNSSSNVSDTGSCTGPNGINQFMSFPLNESGNSQMKTLLALISDLIHQSVSHCQTYANGTKKSLLLEFKLSNFDLDTDYCNDEDTTKVSLPNITELQRPDGRSVIVSVNGNNVSHFGANEVYRQVVFFRRSVDDSWIRSEDSYICKPSITCDELIMLNSSEFKWLNSDKHTLLLLANNETLTTGQFIAVSDNSVLICRNEFDKSLVRLFAVTFYAGTEGQVLATMIGIPISIVFLSFVIITYLTFPELRNLPGKTVMSLSDVLLFAQLLLLFGIDKIAYKAVCLIITLILHYSWLAVFFWTNVLAFDLACTFGGKQGVKGANSSTRFIKYSLYAWGTPAILVGITALLHFTLPVEGKTENIYDIESSCFLRVGNPTLIAVSVPILFILFCNCGLFAYTIVGIQRTRSVSKILHDDSDKAHQIKKDLHLSARLSVILGLPWIIGIMIPFTNLPELWYIFVILCCCQGPVIFLSFIWNKRVVNLWRAKLGCKNRADASKSCSGRNEHSTSMSSTKKTQLSGRF